MTSNEWEDIRIGFDEYGFEPSTLCDSEEVINQYRKAFKNVSKDLKDYEKIKSIMKIPIQDIIKKLRKIEEIEKELGISILDFYKILKVRHIWAEVGLDLTNRFDELVLFDIKEFDVELNRILLKENKYNLRSIPFNMYKICFWLNKDKSE